MLGDFSYSNPTRLFFGKNALSICIFPRACYFIIIHQNNKRRTMRPQRNGRIRPKKGRHHGRGNQRKT